MKIKRTKYLFISTPKGKNFFYYQFLKGNTGSNKYKSFEFVSSDNPHSNPDIIQMAKESLPEVLFRQEYLAHFVDNSAVFENIDTLAVVEPITVPKPGNKYFAGIDIVNKKVYKNFCKTNNIATQEDILMSNEINHKKDITTNLKTISTNTITFFKNYVTLKNIILFLIVIGMIAVIIYYILNKKLPFKISNKK